MSGESQFERYNPRRDADALAIIDQERAEVIDVVRTSERFWIAWRDEEKHETRAYALFHTHEYEGDFETYTIDDVRRAFSGHLDALSFYSAAQNALDDVRENVETALATIVRAARVQFGVDLLRRDEDP